MNKSISILAAPNDATHKYDTLYLGTQNASLLSLRVLSDHVVPATWPPRVRSAINTDCVVTGEDGANTGATLANVGVAIGAGN